MHMVIIICAGIMSAHPGCVLDEVKLLNEITPQQCVIKGQEFLAKKQSFYNVNGYNVYAYGCHRA